jgi:ABC-type dipeptide/oligopeptide/nickel transport system permease subunit
MNTIIPPVADMLSVLKLFLIPVGGGIPAGVMLAKAKAMVWPVTTLLYLVSDIILAFLFEPVLRLLAFICSKITFLSRVAAAMKAATARSVHHMAGTGAGPVGLIMISFGVDPMTGRATALAAGHSFIMGWVFAIAGDMLYFGVIAVRTLKLNTYIKDPNITMLIILIAMFSVPTIIRIVRSKILRHPV